jgi:hypothetical protein
MRPLCAGSSPGATSPSATRRWVNGYETFLMLPPASGGSTKTDQLLWFAFCPFCTLARCTDEAAFATHYALCPPNSPFERQLPNEVWRERSAGPYDLPPTSSIWFSWAPGGWATFRRRWPPLRRRDAVGPDANQRPKAPRGGLCGDWARRRAFKAAVRSLPLPESARWSLRRPRP